MEKEIREIYEILLTLDADSQMKVISECASRIGTIEWQEGVKELIKRIENL